MREKIYSCSGVTAQSNKKKMKNTPLFLAAVVVMRDEGVVEKVVSEYTSPLLELLFNAYRLLVVCLLFRGFEVC